MYRVYTIGHSNLTQERLLGLLTQVQIELLVDVRSNPNSRWVPHANRKDLKKILESDGIHYLYLGNMLGGRPSDPDCYDFLTGKANYQAIQKKDYFKQGINQVVKRLKKYRVCIMCSEEDPTFCHRNLLVAMSLRQEGITVLHIRADGRIQTDEELWKEKTGVPANQYQLI
ncbi:MAG: DUF488 domain-containing protein [Dehalococcoidia bacterium]|nr:DUF488 domain-containing protein [Dehalococcoidia bacterium]